ncbi:helix-turn-helix domain-containing protein [Paenibacillus sp. OAS669]|uniref:helix-turn-helix domain-containing protein n=1 Tax=Paenibacillus sp. OAS669 TaxID=2663821 RepID=UPI00178A08C5|nr:helix-turn-helix domain-containing protein [Paenibacillus sp. OAS669]MBE1440898.1 AraC-like DNA-binding protein [Paenibacillus sp. OAS669]
MKAPQSNYIKRMLFSYLPILFVTVSLLIFIFISVFNQINVRNAIQANYLTAAFIVNVVDNSLKGIADDAQKMADTNGQLRFFLEGPSDRALEFDISKLLHNLMDLRYGLIDSVYLYRAKDSKVLDQNALRPIELFPDRNYIRSSIEQPLMEGWSSPRLKQNEGNDMAISVTSLVIKIPRDSGSLGYLIINVNLSSLHTFISQMINQELTEVQLFDTKGNPFFKGRPDSIDHGVNADIVSDYTNWKYRISIKGDQWFNNLVQGNTILLILGLGVIIFAVGSTFYVTRRSYKPIKAILQRIDRFPSMVKSVDQKGSKDEFAFIDQAIERLITNNMDFQEKQQEHQVIRRQQFLQILLKGEYEDDRDAWEQERQHFGLTSGKFIVALVEIDHYVQFGLQYNPKDQALFKFIISSVAFEIAEQNGQRIMSEWISKHQFVILLLSDDTETLEHRILQMSEQIRAWVDKNLDFTVTIGIGSAAENESAISRSFDDALEAVNRKVTLGINQIIDTVEWSSHSHGDWFNYLEIIRTIVRQLRMSDTGWENELRRLFREMTVECLPKDEVERQLHYFVFHLEYEMEKVLPETVKAWLQEAKPDLLLAIAQSDTLPEVESAFHSVLEQLFQFIEELARNRRHDALMKEIRNYVAEHYTDPNLSLAMLSDRFQISSKYLSQLFKESIGQNFVDFLIFLRMEYAKALLRETDISVGEVSEKAGYTNTTSFIRTFKKMVGVSPGLYRESQPKKQ